MTLLFRPNKLHGFMICAYLLVISLTQTSSRKNEIFSLSEFWAFFLWLLSLAFVAASVDKFENNEKVFCCFLFCKSTRPDIYTERCIIFMFFAYANSGINNNNHLGISAEETPLARLLPNLGKQKAKRRNREKTVVFLSYECLYFD